MKKHMSAALFLTIGTAVASCVFVSCDGPPVQRHDSPDMTDAEKRAAIDRMTAEYRKEYEDVPELSVSELVSRMETEDVIVVDVRTRPEQAVSMIPGAIPQSEFESHKEKYKDKTVITYCTIGSRSGRYAHLLRSEGFIAHNLSGSILAWAHAGRLLVGPGGAETRRVHVYGPKWNLLPRGYIPVW